MWKTKKNFFIVWVIVFAIVYTLTVVFWFLPRQKEVDDANVGKAKPEQIGNHIWYVIWGETVAAIFSGLFILFAKYKNK